MPTTLHDPAERTFSTLPSGTPTQPLGDEAEVVPQHEEPVDPDRRRSFDLGGHGGYPGNVTRIAPRGGAA
jgi:hypothetical protein